MSQTVHSDLPLKAILVGILAEHDRHRLCLPHGEHSAVLLRLLLLEQDVESVTGLKNAISLGLVAAGSEYVGAVVEVNVAQIQ